MKYLLLIFLLISNMAQANTEISSVGTNLGIGTTSVANALSIASTLAVGGTTYMNTAAPSNGAIIQGNLGIGSLAPGQSLDVNGTLRGTAFIKIGGTSSQFLKADGSIDSTSYGTGSGTVNSGTVNRLAVYATTGTAVSDQTIIYEDGTNVGIGTAGPSTLFDVNRKLNVLSGGNVGIGIINPTYLLHVKDSITTSSQPTDLGMIVQDSQGTPRIGGYAFGGANDFVVGAISNHRLNIVNNSGSTVCEAFGTDKTVSIQQTTCTVGANTHFFMDANGNVGISSIAPGTALDVTGSIRASTNIGVGTYSVCTTSGNCPSSGGGSSQWTGTNPIYVTGINVGIGSATPGQTLDVQGTIRVSATGTALDVEGTQSFAGFMGKVGIGTTTVNGANNNGVGGLTVVNGNVGIGTWNPVDLFSIGNGNSAFRVNATGNITSLTNNTSANLNSSTLNFNNAGSNATVTNASSTSASSLSLSGSSAVNGSVGVKSTSGVGTVDFIKFNVGNNGNVESMRIQDASQSASVGIGTSSPGGSLDVEATLRPIVFNGLNNSNGNVGIGSYTPGQLLDVQGTVRITTASTGTSLDVEGTLSTSYFAGNVGIGTTVATSPLKVFSTGAGTLSLDSNAVSKGGCIEMKDYDGSGYTYLYANNGVLFTTTTSCK